MLLDATTFESTYKAPLAAEVREALGLPDGVDFEIVVTVPLVAATSGGAMLVVGGAEPPPIAERAGRSRSATCAARASTPRC